MTLSDFDEETADAGQLIEEIIRIAVTDYRALTDHIKSLDNENSNHDLVDIVMVKYLENISRVDSYIDKLQEKFKIASLPHLLLEIRKKQHEIRLKKAKKTQNSE